MYLTDGVCFSLTYSETMFLMHWRTVSIRSPDFRSNWSRVFTSQMGLVSVEAVKPDRQMDRYE